MLEKMEEQIKFALKLARSSETAVARAAPTMACGSPPGSAAGASNFSAGPSISQVGSLQVAPLTAAALEAMQSQTRLRSEFAGPSPPQAGGVARGSLANSLVYDSGGVWINTIHGAKWCSAKGPHNLDVEGVCPAALLPPSVDRDAYCTGGESCTHWLPRNFSRVLATKTLPASSLIAVSYTHLTLPTIYPV